MGAYCKHFNPPSDCATCRSDRGAPTLSIRPYQNAAGTFSVELHVHGLPTDSMAEKVADMLTTFMAGKEIKTN
jgi:hypothetical protein